MNQKKKRRKINPKLQQNKGFTEMQSVKPGNANVLQMHKEAFKKKK